MKYFDQGPKRPVLEGKTLPHGSDRLTAPSHLTWTEACGIFRVWEIGRPDVTGYAATLKQAAENLLECVRLNNRHHEQTLEIEVSLL